MISHEGMISYKGVYYCDGELIPWDIVDEVGDIYFRRARYLKLPNPPAVFVFYSNEEVKYTARIGKIIKRYNDLFLKAEVNFLRRKSGFLSPVAILYWAVGQRRLNAKRKNKKLPQSWCSLWIPYPY